MSPVSNALHCYDVDDVLSDPDLVFGTHVAIAIAAVLSENGNDVHEAKVSQK